MPEPDVQVPRFLELLWRGPQRPRRGPRPALSLGSVAAAAVAIADEHGLPAVSMSRLADRLGVTTMALYRYVPSKDDLLVVMLDHASAGAPKVADGGWRAQLEAWCRGYRTVLMSHPWALQIPISGPPTTPNQLDWMEAGIRPTADLGLSAAERVQVLLQLTNYVSGDAQLNAQLDKQRAGARDTGASQSVSAPWAVLVGHLADPGRYPVVLRMVTDGEFEEDDDPVEQFEFGLATTLDGIEALVMGRN